MRNPPLLSSLWNDVGVESAGGLPQSSHRFMSVNWLLGGAILIVWFVLSLPELMGFVHLIHSLSFFNIAILAGAIAVLVIQSLHYRKEWEISIEPRVHRFPLMVMVGAAIACVLSRWCLDLEQLSIIWFVIGSYGAVGLFCHPRVWQRGLPFMGAFTMLTLLLALEFTDLGHLARTSVAELVEQLLKPFGVTAITSEDILVLSTGVAFVDIPCSGFKNIEIGSLFFIAASLLERKQMGLKWLLLGVLNGGLLILSNVGRILAIVVVTFVFQQPTLAEILHVPLGLLGFVTVCLVTLQLLRWVPRQSPRQNAGLSLERDDRSAQSCSMQQLSIRPAAVALSVLIGLAVVPAPTPHPTVPGFLNGMEWPTELQAQPLDLTETEQKFFTRFPGAVADKQSFQFHDVSGSMILVASSSWQAHHAPELCFSARGMTINQMQKQALTSDITGRWLSLNQGDRQAAYWFQSPNRTTDHYLDRVWSEITRRDSTWTMATILFDTPVTSDDTDVQTLLEDVHGAIAGAMTSLKPIERTYPS
ncbi:MAG: exosortase O [Leptolyngbyaceae bacterium]|nr:exosortase O [Leptolyngbyaceae bacterium]